MNDDNKLFVTLLLALAVILAIGVLVSTAIDNYNIRHMAELGYEQTTIAGCRFPVWRKAD